MIRMVEFLQKLFTIDDISKYRIILVSQYFLRRYIIVRHFLISHIPRLETSEEELVLSCKKNLIKLVCPESIHKSSADRGRIKGAS